MFAVFVAGAGGLAYGFWRLTLGGFVWWGRLLSPPLLVVSAWGLKLANDYGDQHHYPNGGTVTAAASLFLFPPAVGATGGLIGIGMTWVWSFTPAGRAARGDSEAAGREGRRSGWPAENAEPPFSFRVPHHEAWHRLALPIFVIVVALLGLVSVLVHSDVPVSIPVAFLVVLAPWLVPVVLPAYWRRLDVRRDGLRVVRLGSDRLIPWRDLVDIEITPDGGSQNGESRIWLLTTTGRVGTDVPKADATSLQRWRRLILAARPRHAQPNREPSSHHVALPQRVSQALHIRRRGAILWLLIVLTAWPYLALAMQ